MSWRPKTKTELQDEKSQIIKAIESASDKKAKILFRRKRWIEQRLEDYENWKRRKSKRDQLAVKVKDEKYLIKAQELQEKRIKTRGRI